MKYGAVTVLGLKTDNTVQSTVILQLGGNALDFRINDKSRCTDRGPSTIR